MAKYFEGGGRQIDRQNMQVTYDFDNLEIEVPKVTGPGGKEMGSAKWRIDGKLTLSTELLERQPIE